MRPLTPFNKPREPHLNLRHQVIPDAAVRRWYFEFNNGWKDCQRCPLSKNRNRVVQFRGIIPARILFVGEAPGQSEDEVGRPFCGPAGSLFDEMIAECGIEDGDFTVINILGCIPYNDACNAVRKPEKAEIRACRPRFIELLAHIRAKHVVLMGDTAEANFMPSLKVPGVEAQVSFCPGTIVTVPHPSAILQTGPSNAVILRKRFILGLKSILN